MKREVSAKALLAGVDFDMGSKDLMLLNLKTR